MKVADHDPDVANLCALIDSLTAMIHTGRPDGYLDFFNQRWLKFFGLRLQELEGWNWTSAVHRDDVAALVARWRACLVSGKPFGFEARVRRADKEYRWMLHQKVAVRDESDHIVKWYRSSVKIEVRKQAEFEILDLYKFPSEIAIRLSFFVNEGGAIEFEFAVVKLALEAERLPKRSAETKSGISGSSIVGFKGWRSGHDKRSFQVHRRRLVSTEQRCTGACVAYSSGRSLRFLPDEREMP